jgi:hypothetical protein
VGNFNIDGGGGSAVLTDGLKGTEAFDTSTYAVAGNDANPWNPGIDANPALGLTATYTFDTTVNTAGYDLTSVDIFSGWNDNGRDQILVEVLYSTVAAPTTFISLTTIDFNPSNSGNPVWGRATLTDSGGIAATAVASIQFNFNLGAENGYTGYREIDVLGAPSAIPEPSTAAALAGLGILGFVALRRRRA